MLLSVTGGELTVCENCAFLDYYASRTSNFVPTFRDNLSVPSSRVKNKKERRAELRTSRRKPEVTHGVRFIDRCQ